MKKMSLPQQAEFIAIKNSKCSEMKKDKVVNKFIWFVFFKKASIKI